MIVIPTYNERRNIRELMERLRKVLPKDPVLFVDDNSPDGTAQEIRELMKTDPNMRLMVRQGKQGLGSAYREGFKEAIADPGVDYVVEMDADLSHAPEALPGMLAALKDSDAVIGSRYVQGGRTENWNFWRRLISRAGNWYARILSGNFAHDLTAGLVAYRKEALKRIDLESIRSDGYAFQIELKALLYRSGCRIREVPITFSERRVGESKFSSGIFGEGMSLPWKLLVRNAAANKAEVVLGAIVLLVPLVVYVYTAPHTIYLGDSAEFTMAIAATGVPHPPGYPTYMVLAKLFSLLPLGTLAFRLSLFSAVCAVLSLFFLYLTGLRLFTGKARSFPQVLAAAFAPLLLAFSDIFWSQAIMAKIYQLHLLFVCVLVWLVVKYWQRPQGKYVLWSALLFGLGFGAHQMILFFVPLFVIAFLVRKIPDSKLYELHPSVRLKTAVAACVLGVLGLAAYAYLPISSSFHPAYQWADTSASLGAFLKHVGRSEYGDLAAGFAWKYKAEFITSFLGNVFDQFGFLLLAAVPGLWWLLKHRRNFALLGLGIFSLNSLGIILMRSLPWTFDGAAYTSFYYLPAYAIAAIWIAAGLYWIFSAVPAKSFATGGLALSLALSAGFFARHNFTANDLHDFRFLDDYSRKLLSSLEPNAVLMVSFDGTASDSMVFSLFYQQRINHVRPDVKLADGYDIYPEADRDAINRIYGLDRIENFRSLLVRYISRQPAFRDRPLYTTFSADGLDRDWFSVSNGMAFRFFAGQPHEVNFSRPGISDRDEKNLAQSYFGRDLLAQYYYGLAGGLLDAGDRPGAEDSFLSAIANDNEVASQDSMGFIAHRAKMDNQKP
ncbi:MAG: protein O-mannosyl-transferase family [Candidatus Saccharibacteria bacterium]